MSPSPNPAPSMGDFVPGRNSSSRDKKIQERKHGALREPPEVTLPILSKSENGCVANILIPGRLLSEAIQFCFETLGLDSNTFGVSQNGTGLGSCPGEAEKSYFYGYVAVLQFMNSGSSWRRKSGGERRHSACRISVFIYRMYPVGIRDDQAGSSGESPFDTVEP